MKREYATSPEGGRWVAVCFRIAGRVDEGYLAFVGERANWLSLDGWAAMAGDGRVDVVAAGPEALIGALEMACWLGPLDSLVDTIEVTPEPLRRFQGFELRS